MTVVRFNDRLRQAILAKNSLISVGFDPTPELTGVDYRNPSVYRLVKWAMGILEPVVDIIPVIKPNLAFWEGYGPAGIQALVEFRRETRGIENLLWLQDCKRGDIGKSNMGTDHLVFQILEADALTVPPYLGLGSLVPFIHREGKAVFVLVRTSNEEAGEFQDDVSEVGTLGELERIKASPAEVLLDVNSLALYQKVAWRLTEVSAPADLGAVAGATYASELNEVRTILGPHRPILVPGLGPVQGGKPEDAIPAALGESKDGLAIFNFSSEIARAHASGGVSSVRTLVVEKRNQVNDFRN